MDKPLSFIHLIVVCFLVLGFSGCKDAPSRLDQPITVAFYNVENWFDLHYSSREYREYTGRCCGWNRYAFTAKQQAIVKSVLALNPTIIGLAEVENDTIVQTLQRELKKNGLNLPFVATAPSSLSATTVGLLSAFPIIDTAWYHSVRDCSLAFRPLLVCRVLFDWTDTISVLVNHWPSQRNPDSLRVQAAEILAEVLHKHPSSGGSIVMGDFNTPFTAFCPEKARQLPPNALAKAPLHLVQQQLHGGNNALHNLWQLVPAGARGSYVYRGRLQALDQMLVSTSLLKRYSVASFAAFTDQGALLRDQKPFSWQIIHTEEPVHAGEGVSDHLPIRLQLRRGKHPSAALTFSDPPGWQIRILQHTLTFSSPNDSTFLLGGYSTGKALIQLQKICSDPVALRLQISGAGPLMVRYQKAGNDSWSYLRPGQATAYRGGRYFQGPQQYELTAPQHLQTIEIRSKQLGPVKLALTLRKPNAAAPAKNRRNNF